LKKVKNGKTSRNKTIEKELKNNFPLRNEKTLL